MILRLVVAALTTLCAAPALAIVGPRLPAAMEEAPVDRAIENVARDTEIAPAQRERVLGRLHLIAYAQGQAGR